MEAESKNAERRPSPREWATQNPGEWRMRWDIPDEELNAAVVWEFARGQADFLRVAAEAETYSFIEAEIDDLVCKQIAGTISEEERIEFARLKEKRASVPDSMFRAPLRFIWSMPQFPRIPWLGLSEDVRRDLAKEFAHKPLAGLRQLKIGSADTAMFIEEMQRQQKQIFKVVPEDFEWSAAADFPFPDATLVLDEGGYKVVLALVAFETKAPNEVITTAAQRIADAYREGLPRKPTTIGPKKRRAKSLLLGLALARFRDVTSGTWEDIYDVIEPELRREAPPKAKRTPFDTHITKQKAASFPSFARLIAEVEEVSGAFFEEVAKIVSE